MNKTQNKYKSNNSRAQNRTSAFLHDRGISICQASASVKTAILVPKFHSRRNPICLLNTKKKRFCNPVAAYAIEANECHGISTQQKPGFAALNMGRKKGKYHVCHNFVLGRIQFSCSCSWKRGDVTKTRNEEQARGKGKIKKKREQKRELEI